MTGARKISMWKIFLVFAASEPSRQLICGIADNRFSPV
jgi:hypothetical protein